MGKTYRKDREGKEYQEGRPNGHKTYKCRCESCKQMRQKTIQENIADRDMRIQLKNIQK